MEKLIRRLKSDLEWAKNEHCEAQVTRGDDAIGRKWVRCPDRPTTLVQDLEEAIRAIDRNQVVQEKFTTWVSTQKKMPSIRQKVLIKDRSGQVVLVEVYMSGFFSPDGKFYQKADVNEWMPYLEGLDDLEGEFDD